MAYLRGRWYVWCDGADMNIWAREAADDVTEYVRSCDFAAGVAIPLRAFDAVALMRVAELLAEGKVTRRSTLAMFKRHGGNFGSDDVARLLGLPTVMEVVAATRKRPSPGRRAAIRGARKAGRT